MVTCANCETISEEDLRTPEASDSEPEEDDNLDPDDEDYVVELDELKSMTQEEAQLLNELWVLLVACCLHINSNLLILL